ncbi:MerR family transcriptional regulator [Actinomycetospora sp. NBRC 106378]|uniref:MerR family transcriptional regulator n=1 Tax=Actinomycetospora sp. NBRC 106378 TaxID=3032208 RepID=UPI0024A1107D|nr:MerR family transcriptional regulator [Actinomycetospora sp. NBRC 106378]GLZ55676.1 MerR family transcriptional regulator [Actinomycetospora sp. NBRC 106378]
MSDGLMQIGTVAERIGLSLRTIRYYEEVGLVAPAGRSPGGFRLYSEDDVAQLRLIMRMKPLDFSLEQMRDLLDAVAELAADPPPTGDRRAELTARVAAHRTAVQEKVRSLRDLLARAEEFADLLGSPTVLHP